MMACVGDCLREYFALRVEMASAVTVPGALGEPQTGLVHSLLSRTEERIRATLDAHATTLQRLESMLDRLVQLYLLHTPEVARELHGGAVASANRRSHEAVVASGASWTRAAILSSAGLSM